VLSTRKTHPSRRNDLRKLRQKHRKSFEQQGRRIQRYRKFATERVTVEFNSEQISEAAIKKTIRDVGYQVIEREKCGRY
jgi:copper chaperone CopZ